jgi:predicted nucleic acid-binding protein
MYCLDASIITNSEIENEKFHEYSKKLMQKIKERGITVIVPEIVLPEISSAVARGTDDAEKALKSVKELRQIPNFVFIP